MNLDLSIIVICITASVLTAVLIKNLHWAVRCWIKAYELRTQIIEKRLEWDIKTYKSEGQ